MNRTLRLIAFAGALVFLVSGIRAQTPEPGAMPLPETYFPALKTLIDSAVQQSPRMIARNTENAIAENNRIIARAGQLPSAGGYLSYYPWDRQQRADLSGTTSVKKLGYSLSVSQPVYYWGALKNATRIGELQLKIAQGLTADTYRLLVNEIRGQFLQLILKKASLVRARFNQKIKDDQLDLAQQKVQKHVMAESDIFGPTIYAEQARLAADRAQEDLENAESLLAKLTGSAPLTDDQIPDEVPVVTPVSTAMQSRLTEFTAQPELDTYNLRGLRDQIEIERLNYDIANTRLRPKLNAVIGVSQDQQHYSLATSYKYQVRDYYAGASISWSIFDGFATKSVKASSLARRRQLEQAYRDQTADQIAAVRSQVRQLEFSARNLAIVEKLLGSSSNAVRVRKDDLARGLASDADVTAAQLDFYDTQMNAFSARYDYLMGVANFLSSIMEDPALANVRLPHQ